MLTEYPVITSMKQIISRMKKVEDAACWTAMNSPSMAMNSKSDRIWSIIERIPMRVDFMISTNNRRIADVTRMSLSVTPQVAFDKSCTENRTVGSAKLTPNRN